MAVVYGVDLKPRQNRTTSNTLRMHMWGIPLLLLDITLTSMVIRQLITLLVN